METIPELDARTASIAREAALAVFAQLQNTLAPKPPERPVWLTPNEVARDYKITLRGLEDMRRKCVGPQWHRFGSRAVRYKLSEIEAHLESQKGGAA